MTAHSPGPERQAPAESLLAAVWAAGPGLQPQSRDHTTSKGQEPVVLTTPFYIFINLYIYAWGFPNGSVGKESTCNAGDVGSIPGLGRSPGEGHGNPLQYSCLENPVYKGAWRATVQRVSKSWT